MDRVKNGKCNEKKSFVVDRHEYTYDSLYYIPAAIEGFQPSLLAVGKSECSIRYDDDLEI